MKKTSFLSLSWWLGAALLVLACAATAADLPSIRIMATGGTIAGMGKSATEAGYEPSKIPVENLINAVPELNRDC